MPNANLPRSEYLGYVPMNDAPGADMTLDDLFPPEGSQQQSQAVAPETTPTAPPQAPESQPFLKAGETVYLTAEEAAKGTVHKDELIAKQRAFLKDLGYDPNTFQRVEQPQAPSAPVQNGQFTYYTDGTKLYEDMAQAALSKDPRKWGQVFRQAVQEGIAAELSSYVPLLAEVADQKARRTVTEQVPDFNQFINSAEHAEVLNRVPLLKDAIERARMAPNASEQLSQLYQIEYLINRGLKVGSTPAPQVQAPPVQPPTVRTTTPPATMTPPPPGQNFGANEWTTSRDARQQLIKDREQRGMKDIDWRTLGL